MKIKDLIYNIDKSDKNKTNVEIYSFAEEFNIQINYVEQNRLVYYWAGNWYCTDTWVGYRVYYFDGKPVAISSQTGRKMDEQIEWLDDASYKKVKEYLCSFIIQEEDNINSIDLNEEVEDHYHIEFYDQLLPHHKNQYGLYNGKKVKILEGIKEDKFDYVQKNVLIEFEDGTQDTVILRLIEFAYHLEK